MTAPVVRAWQGWAPRLLSILRIVVAFLYMAHGTQKLFAFPTGVGPQGTGTVDLATRYGAAGVIEVTCGALLLIGLFSQLAAFIASGEMAAAYFLAHAPHGFWPIMNRGEIVVAFCFVWLYISAAGPGPWSVDALRVAGRRSQVA
ncbi:MAG TPA: DoxX family protein [Gemmatimonadales bacterium]|nr:DoxX family protein [Gemmatimonadales bacterium]